jgi:hypothetical protein
VWKEGRSVSATEAVAAAWASLMHSATVFPSGGVITSVKTPSASVFAE